MALPKVVNTKSMFAFLCATLEKIENEQISTDQVDSICKVTNQAGNYLDYELKRAHALSDKEVKDQHRNLELKNFDSIPE